MASREGRSFTRHKLAVVGLIIVGLMTCSALTAGLIAPYRPEVQQLSQNLARPTAEHWFGQDKLGRDIFSRVLYGSRISLIVGLSVVGISLSVGLLVGSLAGFYGGLWDEGLMRVVDILLAFPGILLAISITAVMGPGLSHVVFALCLTGWVGYARLVRGQIMAVKESEYVVAARSLGAGDLRLFLRHLLPNILAPIIVEATFGLAGAILAEAGLSFLGLGTAPPTPSWGGMLNEGRQFLLAAPHLTIFPGLAIMAVVMGFNFLGDGLRDYLDVKTELR